VKNCGITIRTNTTVEYDVQVVHANGTVVKPADRDSTVSAKEVLCVTLSQVVHLAPQQTIVVRATVEWASVAINWLFPFVNAGMCSLACIIPTDSAILNPQSANAMSPGKSF